MRLLRDHVVPACSTRKPHASVHYLRFFLGRSQPTSSAVPALCRPEKPSHVVAHDLATIPQMCHSMCDPHAFAHAVPTFSSFQTKLKSHFPWDVFPDSPRGRVGALFPALPWHFVHPCVTAVLLLCYVSLIPCLLPWTRNLPKGQTVLFMFVYSKARHRECSP